MKMFEACTAFVSMYFNKMILSQKTAKNAKHVLHVHFISRASRDVQT